MFSTALTLIIQSLPLILQATKVITPKMSSLIQDLGASTTGLITSIATHKSVPDVVTATLVGLRGELATLQADTALPPQTLQQIATLLEAIDDALTADAAAQKETDPSTLQSLPTDL